MKHLDTIMKESVCGKCGNLRYWDGYFCSNLPEELNKYVEYTGLDELYHFKFGIQVKECRNFSPRVPCNVAPANHECQFWCLGLPGKGKCIYADLFLH